MDATLYLALIDSSVTLAFLAVAYMALICASLALSVEVVFGLLPWPALCDGGACALIFVLFIGRVTMCNALEFLAIDFNDAGSFVALDDIGRPLNYGFVFGG